MNWERFRGVWISRFYQTLKRPSLITELFKDEKNDFWINYKAKKWFLDHAKNCRVFEFGSGYSTKHIAKVAKEIISVEDNKEWFEQTKHDTRVIFAKNNKDYVHSIDDLGLFDMIFVDGSTRVVCATNAWKNLKVGGFMIIDDVNYNHFDNKFEEFKRGHFHFRLGGFKSNTGGYWETGIIFKGSD